jgi:hypothetical protein
MTLMRDTTALAIAFCGREHFAQHAVDAEAHDQAVLERLDVDVARAFLDRLGQQRVDQTDDRRVVFGFGQVLGLRQLVGQRLEVEIVVEVGDHRARVAALLVERAQQAFETRHVVMRQLQRRAEVAAQLGQRLGAHAIAIGDLGDITVPADQRRAIAPGKAETWSGWMGGWVSHASRSLKIEPRRTRRTRRRARIGKCHKGEKQLLRTICCCVSLCTSSCSSCPSWVNLSILGINACPSAAARCMARRRARDLP